jgi:hypothetical protein
MQSGGRACLQPPAPAFHPLRGLGDGKGEAKMRGPSPSRSRYLGGESRLGEVAPEPVGQFVFGEFAGGEGDESDDQFRVAGR